MLARRTVLAVPLCFVAVLSLPANAFDPVPKPPEPKLTRILHLKDIDTREAVTLLRSEVQVRQIAEIRDLNVVVVKGNADRIERSVALLRERNAIADIVVPHGPEYEAAARETPLATRVFRVEGLDIRAVKTILRAMYQVPEFTELPGEAGISIRAPVARLDAGEALLEALGVLVSATEPGK